MRYQTINENEILDTQTSLIWMKTYKEQLSFNEALEYAERVACETDQAWRVPTIEELTTLVESNLHNPSSSFPNMPSRLFWSSSPYVCVTSYVCYVNFYTGNVNFSSHDYYYTVRLVRCG